MASRATMSERRSKRSAFREDDFAGGCFVDEDRREDLRGCSVTAIATMLRFDATGE